MDVRSLGLRTDLALLRLGGSEIEDHADHLVVRTPDNPTFWWGNFLLLDRPPPAADVLRWLDRFAAAFPQARHLAFAFDGVTGSVTDLAAFAERGLVCEAETVLTATAVREPPRPNRTATYRELTTDDDWAQSVVLRVAARDEGDDGDVGEDDEGYRTFAERKVATNRAMVEAGHGGWFGAFVDGRLACQMGLFAASPGLARFQSVETDPAFRGRGLAGTLVHHVSRYGFEHLGATTLVMVADPDYLAVRIYRSVGFVDAETHLQAERAPIGAPDQQLTG